MNNGFELEEKRRPLLIKLDLYLLNSGSVKLLDS